MARRSSSILSLLVCTALLGACDDPLAVTPAAGAEEEVADQPGIDMPVEPVAPQAPAMAQAQADASAVSPASPQEVNEPAQPAAPQGPQEEEVVPEGAEPIPAPQAPKAPLETPQMASMMVDLDIETMLAADPIAMTSVKAKPAPGPSIAGKPNVGPFVPNAKAMWLSLKPGTDQAILEIGVRESDVKYLPGTGDDKMLMVDSDGLGNFVKMPLKAVNDVHTPENCVDRGHEKLRFFSTPMRIDVSRMHAVMTEYNNRREREVVEFRPGTPEVARRHHAHRIDVDKFLEGKKVDLSLVAQMSPLGTLGARPVRINRDRSLMIRDLRVIEDPRRTVNPCDRPSNDNMNKVWSFGFLMKEMAKQSGVSTEQFVESWLAKWSDDQAIWSKDGTLLDEISDHTGRALQRGVIRDWRRRSGGRHLDLRIAPFRLLAIIYRPDLATRSPLLAPEKNNPGELRFVFGMMRTRDLNHDGDANDWFESCRSIEASVILEYDIPAAGCERAKAWANEFIDLSDLKPGSEKYNSHLERLSRFVVRSGAAPDRPNKSAIGQVRTNEIGLSTAWQMREFHLSEETGLLEQTTVEETFRHHGRHFSRTRNTPSPASLRGSHIMFNEIEENMSMILDGRYTMPEVSSHGEPLLSGGVTLLGPFGRFDSHQYRTHEQRQARFNIGVNTCDGCHTAETGTLFYHIFPNRPGRQTRFSAYLQNSPHKTSHLNARLQLEHHEFDETKTRIQALHGMANQVCAVGRGIVPLQMTEAPLKRQH